MSISYLFFFGVEVVIKIPSSVSVSFVKNLLRFHYKVHYEYKTENFQDGVFKKFPRNFQKFLEDILLHL